MILADNKLQVAKYRLAYIVTFPIGIISILYGFMAKASTAETITSIVLGALLLLSFIVLLIIRPEYIYMAIEKNSKLVVRNYNAFPLFREYKAFEIPLNAIHGFEFSSMLMFRKTFRLIIKSNNKIGKYPWLSVSAVSAKHKKMIEESLNKIIPKK